MSYKKQIKVFIKGMHCRSCELLLEDRLKEVDRIKSVDVNYKTGRALIGYEKGTPNMYAIKNTISEAGYELGNPEKLPFLSRDKQEYSSLGIAFLLLMIVYLALKGFGITEISLGSNLSSPSWGLIVVIGLVAGFSTCMALVGGLSLGLSAKFAENNPEATTKQKFRPHLHFNIGRIIAYGWLGGILGTLGMAFKMSALANGVITIFVGLVMLLMGLQLINIFPRLNNVKLVLPKSISKILGRKRNNQEYGHERSMVIGALTFFLPCGFTQAMQLYAISTGSFGAGALTMGLFALGTAPGLLSIGGVTSIVKGKFKERFFKFAGLAVILFGLFNLSNGFNLTGFRFDSLWPISEAARGGAANDPNVIMENGVQVVRMIEHSRGYSPSSFAIKKGVPVKWVIDAQAPYSCASALIVPKLGIQKNLKAGENIIEFIPEEVGNIPFSCSMGMYTGIFRVYDEDNVSVDTINNESALASSGSSGATCGVPLGETSSGSFGCGSGSTVEKDEVETLAEKEGDTQIISGIYTSSNYLQPNSFRVKSGVKTTLNIDVRDNGYGCGYSIMIPGLYDRDIPLKKGVPINMEFTPNKKGTYKITCGMDMITFGFITVE